MQSRAKALTIKRKAGTFVSLEMGMFGHFSTVDSAIFIAAQT